MPSPSQANLRRLLALSCGLAVACSALASPDANPDPEGSPGQTKPEPGCGASGSSEFAAPGTEAYREAAKKRVALEKELNRIRGKHFRNVRHLETRQAGLALLREHTDPSEYAMLIDIFGGEAEDVRSALLGIFADAKNDAGDAALAWSAAFAKKEDFRKEALTRLQRRIRDNKDVISDRVKLVVYQALHTRDEKTLVAGANLASGLNMLEAIPWLIPAQVGGSSNAALNQGGGGRAARAYIYVGEQQAYVSDLTPVVSESSAAFDPELSVLSTGVVLQVFDAVVVTYYTEVNSALQGLASRLGGPSTRELGYDVPRWKQWEKDVYIPWAKAHEAELAAVQPKTDRPSQTEKATTADAPSSDKK
jgi:hypothetical protein